MCISLNHMLLNWLEFNGLFTPCRPAYCFHLLVYDLVKSYNRIFLIGETGVTAQSRSRQRQRNMFLLLQLILLLLLHVSHPKHYLVGFLLASFSK